MFQLRRLQEFLYQPPLLIQSVEDGYAVVAVALGVAFLVPAIGFVVERSNGSARRVLLASVLYLPAILAVMVAIRLPVA